jgi:serine O-acetyltransferase
VPLFQTGEHLSVGDEESDNTLEGRTMSYDLGIGKNLPLSGSGDNSAVKPDEIYWSIAEPVDKSRTVPDGLESEETWSQQKAKTNDSLISKEDYEAAPGVATSSSRDRRRVRKMVAKTQEDASLRGAIWHEEHYLDDGSGAIESSLVRLPPTTTISNYYESFAPPEPALHYPHIDLSIPDEIYSEDTDVVWDLMRWEAFMETKREPLLVSFLYSSILNHNCLESSLAFLLANKLSSPAMISTQIQSLILEAIKTDQSIGRKIRADIMAVRDRDPACTCLPDVFLYFKGFHALQTYRVANVLWKAGKHVLSHYLQSQMSQTFQIDIHPNATLGSGIMLDHGTGIVVGETARIGNNCSILHHVTLGGSGKKGVDRHPKVGDGVLLGAGASILGNIQVGEGCQIGAGTLVITDLPPHSVAVGVPAKIIGRFIDVTEQPSIGMNQMMDSKIMVFQSEGI